MTSLNTIYNKVNNTIKNIYNKKMLSVSLGRKRRATEGNKNVHTKIS